MDSNIESPLKATSNPASRIHAGNAIAVKAKPRPRVELPWLIFLALLAGTFVAAYQSQQRADAVASRRFQEIVRAAEMSLQHEFQETKDLLVSAAAFVSVLPPGQVDARSWAYFFNQHATSNDERYSLIQIDYISTNIAPTGATLNTPEPTRLAYAFGKQPGTAAPEVSVDTVSAVATAMAEATRRPGKVVLAPIKILAKTGEAKYPNADASLIAIVLAADRPSVDQKKPAETQNTNLPRAPVSPSRTPDPAREQTAGHLVGLVNLGDILTKISRGEGGRIRATLQGGNAADPALDPTPRAQFSERIGGKSAQEPWSIIISSTPQLDAELSDSSPRSILVAGIIASILLAGLIWLLTRLRQQAESLSESMTARLRDQMKLNEDIIEFNPSPIYRKDVNGRFIAVNRAWEQLSGYRRQDIIGKVNREIQQSELAAENDVADQKLYESDGGYDVAERLVTNADGRQLETMVAKQLIRRADGTVDGIIGTITDLSPVRRLEREIALQREQLDLVISASQQGIWDVELREGGNAYYSSAFREMIGYASGGFPVPFLWKDNIHPDDQALFAKEQVRHFKGETPFFDAEARALCRDGSYLWVRTRAIARRNEQGRATRFVGSIANIGDRKEAETMLIEGSSRIAEAAKAKEAFLATMSHEIRTPLNGVLGMTALLGNTPLNEEQRDYIRLIRASGDTLLNLINDVLDFSKIEAGHMSLESVAVELIALIEETFEIVGEKAREKRIALIYDIRDDVPFYILGDATRLRQILLNLFSNALKFTEHGEIKLTITAQRNQAGKIMLEGRVKDSGVGISAEQIAKLFSPFTQADTSTTRKYGGTGLGLVIVKRLTEAMKGSVRVESAIGEGATFIFTVETQLARGPLRPYMQHQVFDFLGKKILVVDRLASRRTIQHYRYTRWGFDVITVAPDDAAAALRARPGVDIVITDFVEPSAEAEEFQAALAANDSSRLTQNDKRIVSLLLSGSTRADLAQQNMLPAVRHDFFLLRPISITKLFDALMRAVLGELVADKSLRPHSMPAPVDNGHATLERVPTIDEAHTPHLGTADVGLPNNQPYDQPDEQPYAKPTKLKIARIYDVLVAEDNEVNQLVISGLLKNLGHRIMLVGDGRAAVEAATRHRFDVILMDIQMPILDGSAAMREIRAHFADLGGAPCPPIVAMTAHALAGDREGYLADGMDDYLSKPIRSVEVAAALERTAGQILEMESDSPDMDNTNPSAKGAGSRSTPTPPDKTINAAATLGSAPGAAPPGIDRAYEISKSASASIAKAIRAGGNSSKNAAFARSELATRVDQLPLLDTEQLEDLRYLPATPGAASDASDPVGGLIRLFQTKALERLDVIETCLANREWKALSEVAHSLRGASASMGFPRVASLCKDLELASRQLAEAGAGAVIGSNHSGNNHANNTKGIKLATQSELDEIFALTRYYYNQADSALVEWLAATATPPLKE